MVISAGYDLSDKRLPPSGHVMTDNKNESGDLEARIRGACILVVDDNEDQLDLMEVMLRRQGYAHIELTADPVSVAASYSASPYDLILLDMEMPVMNGVDVMRALKGALKGAFMPVIVLTAHEGAEVRMRALGEGAREAAFLVVLDGIQDPQNLGALFRLAGFFGVRGIVLTKDRSASVNATVCDVAAGGAEYVPFAVVANLAQALERAQQSSIWVLGTCERSESSIYEIRRDRHWMLVMGNEGNGMRRLTREKCDQLVSLPPQGSVPSLNVAAAAAACLAVLGRPE